MDKDMIYYLNRADVQTVAQQELGRELTNKEIDKIKDQIAENINWYDAIAYVINNSL